MDSEELLQPECIISGPLWVVLFISRIVGIAPITIKSVPGGWRVRISKIGAFFGQTTAVIIFVGVMYAPCYEMMKTYEDTPFKALSSTSKIIWISDIVLTLGASITGSFTAIRRTRQIIDCLAKLKQITKEINYGEQTLFSSQKKSWLLVIMVFIGGSTLMMSDFAIYIAEVSITGGDVFTASIYFWYSLSFVKLLLLVLQFHITTFSIVPTMQLMNHNLKEMLKEIKKDSQASAFKSHLKPVLIRRNIRTNVYNANKSNNRIRDIMGINGGLKTSPFLLHRLGFHFCSICDMIRRLNDSYGPLMLTLLLGILIHMIINPYYMISGLFFYSPIDTFGNVLLQLVWCIFQFSILLMIVEPCHRTHEQMVVTRELVNQMMRYTPSDNYDMVTELKLFNIHLMLNEPSYSPMKLFTLDRGLVCAIIGSVTTYLFVVIDIN